MSQPRQQQEVLSKPLQIAAAIVVGMTYWIILLALPDSGTQWEPWVRSALSWGGLGVLAVGVIAGVIWLATQNARVGVLSLICLVVGPVAVIVGQITVNRLDLGEGTRFAIGVGGLALAGLILGLIRFDTIRAAVSIPAAVLVIGVTTWPNAEEIVGPDVRTSIIQWMGILLGANGVAEAVTQAAQGTAGDTASPASNASTGSNGSTSDVAAAAFGPPPAASSVKTPTE